MQVWSLRSGRSPAVGNGNPFQYSCWEAPWAVDPGGLYTSWGHKSRPWLGTHSHMHVESGPTSMTSFSQSSLWRPCLPCSHILRCWGWGLQPMNFEGTQLSPWHLLVGVIVLSLLENRDVTTLLVFPHLYWKHTLEARAWGIGYAASSDTHSLQWLSSSLKTTVFRMSCCKC